MNFCTILCSGPNLQDDDGSDNNDSDGGAPRRPPPPSHLKGDSSKLKKTGQQMAGEEVLTRVVSAVDGISFTYPEALNIANVILKTSKKQTTRFAGEITIGSSLKIPCKVFTKVNVLLYMYVYSLYMYKLYNNDWGCLVV